MEIEPGYDPKSYIERPREVEAIIEGRLERNFSEIDPADALPTPLNTITWSTAELTFQSVGSYAVPAGPFGMELPIQLYVGQLEHLGRNGRRKKSNLSTIISKNKPVLFTGTRNGFYAHDPLMIGKGDPFYVVGIQQEELEDHMSRMSALYHELGHVLLFHTDSDTKLLRAALTLNSRDLPDIALSEVYGLELAYAIPALLRDQKPSVTRYTLSKIQERNRSADLVISLFHERNAWAAGMHIVRDNEYPTGFERQRSYFDYAKLCLASYARYYKDGRFVNGLRQNI